MTRGNVKNLKPRTQQGFEEAAKNAVPNAKAELEKDPSAKLDKLIRNQIMLGGYIAKVVISGDFAICTSGALCATVEI